MQSTIGTELKKHATHPAAVRLYAELARERVWLARALAIEADWRYHDGPELAMRYATAAPLVASGSGCAPALDRNTANRTTWPALDAARAHSARAAFRRLLAACHPQLAIGDADPERLQLWRRVKTAYRQGDDQALRRLERILRASGRFETWPIQPAKLRVECQRLRRVRIKVDRRLAAMRGRFPFVLREQLTRNAFDPAEPTGTIAR